MKARFAIAMLIAMVCAGKALAHEGKTHVMGTVSAVDAERVVVTDRDGKTVSIATTKDTKYDQGKAPAKASALVVGTRVVIDVTGEPASLSATEIHVAPPGSHHGDEMHEGEPQQHPHAD